MHLQWVTSPVWKDLDWLVVFYGTSTLVGYLMPILKPEGSICTWSGGARGIMVIVIGNGHSDTSSNPGRDW